jgi:hypothetical protein
MDDPRRRAVAAPIRVRGLGLEVPATVERIHGRGWSEPRGTSCAVSTWIKRQAIFRSHAMSKSDDLLVACPQCHAWPMAASGSKSKWSYQSDMMFRCPRCCHQETFNIARLVDR